MGSANRTRTVLSLFTGAGGLDLGLEAAGFETRVAVEKNDLAVATLRGERKHWNVIPRDIHDVTSAEMLSTAGLREGEVDLLAAGPPCQPFSKSGYWRSGDTRRLDDPRASTLEAYLRVLRDTKPRVFLLENVGGLAYKSKSEGLELIREVVELINRDEGTSYTVCAKLLNAADYGVPQERERLFVIGHREGRSFCFPEPTHHQPGELSLPGVRLRHTAWDALGDLGDDADSSLAVKGKWAGLLPSIPEGENYLFHTDRGGGRPLFGWRRRYWSFLLKLAKNRPSWTITAQPGSAIGPFHWKNRRLSAQELCRLQTFPDGFRVHGGRSAVQRQLGNAVPAALAELLGYEIRKQLLAEALNGYSLSLLSPRREPVPPPEPVVGVPDEYLSLVGDHAAHPGTGNGYGAKARDSSG
jgi:DNA (cytosine-5)-methyltransferase 1